MHTMAQQASAAEDHARVTRAALRRLADRHNVPRPALVAAALRTVEETRFCSGAGR